MDEIEDDAKKGLNVEFYPIRNRHLERHTRRIYRMLLLLFLLSVVIGAIVFADFSGYALQDLKEFFSGNEISRPVDSISSEIPSMYAGHSAPPGPQGETHTRQSHHTAFVDAEGDTGAVQQSGYYGIDVSHWQQNIDWEQVARDTIPQRLHFAIVKATQGIHQTDPDFEQNWKSARDLFEIAGAYHFYVHTDDPAAQSANFINTVALEQGDFPPILDIELNCSGCDSIGVSKNQLVSDLKQYISAIEEHYQIEPILYTNEAFYNNYLSEDFGGYNFWMAKYEQDPPAGLTVFLSREADSMSQPPVVMWQFTDNERVKGITGRVDMNYLPASAKDSLHLVN